MGFSTQWQIGRTLDAAVRPNELSSVYGATIEPSESAAITPYPKLRGNQIETQSLNSGKGAIHVVHWPNITIKREKKHFAWFRERRI